MPRALWLAETTSKALVSRSPARGHVPEHPGGVLRAERLFHAKPREKSLATGCKEARNRVKVGNMHITGGVYQSYSQITTMALIVCINESKPRVLRHQQS